MFQQLVKAVASHFSEDMTRAGCSVSHLDVQGEMRYYISAVRYELPGGRGKKVIASVSHADWDECVKLAVAAVIAAGVPIVEA